MMVVGINRRMISLLIPGGMLLAYVIGIILVGVRGIGRHQNLGRRTIDVAG